MFPHTLDSHRNCTDIPPLFLACRKFPPASNLLLNGSALFFPPANISAAIPLTIRLLARTLHGLHPRFPARSAHIQESYAEIPRTFQATGLVSLLQIESPRSLHPYFGT